jgi:hypothetical protein
MNLFMEIHFLQPIGDHKPEREARHCPQLESTGTDDTAFNAIIICLATYRAFDFR